MNMTKKYQYMGYSEGPFSQKNINLSDEDKSNISVSLGTIFRWKKESDYMAVQLTLKYSHKAEEFFSYGIVITYKVEDGAQVAARIQEGQKPDDLCKQILASALDFFRGALAVMVRNTAFQGFTIPNVDIEDFYKTVNWKVE
jgi:preprotein translocase subunit SecB